MPRMPDMPCASCGKLMWRGSTSLPEGRAKCQPCRRANWEHGTRKGYRDNKCRCAECRRWGSAVSKKHWERMRLKGLKRSAGSGPYINPNVRQSVYLRDNWTCQLCREPVDPSAAPLSNWYPSLDHIIPKSQGGSHDAENLRTAHRWCNSIRGAHGLHDDLFEEAS